MIQIRPWLYVGRYTDTLNGTLLSQHGITAMLQLHEKAEQPGIETLFVPLYEGQPLIIPQIEKALSFVHEHRAGEGRVLIACSAGISRSALMAIATLKQAESLSLVDAFHALHEYHPRAMPDHTHWESLCNYFGEQVPFWDIWQESQKD